MKSGFTWNEDWVDLESKPNDPQLLCSLKAFSILGKEKGVDFCSAKPVALSDANISLSGSVRHFAFSTGGTSGKPARVIHSTDTLASAVDALEKTVGPGPLSSICCLPVRHLGGWMQVFRAIRTGGCVFFCSYRDLAQERMGQKLMGRWLSLVPTQLFQLVKSGRALENLRKARGIFVGGGPLRPDLAKKCREEAIPVWPTYGLSETAGMVTLLKADDFLNGREGVGQAMPHADLLLSEGERKILIRTESLCLAKPPKVFDSGESFQSEDFGEVDAEGYWKILGRADRTIITGGEKVDPALVEKAILETGLVEECVVIGKEDTKWGQVVTAYLSPYGVPLGKVQEITKNTLQGPCYPKKWVTTEKLPVSEMGKPLG